MASEASRWVSYGEAASLLSLSPEATKRLALHRGWPRRSDPAGGMLVAVPETVPDRLASEEDPDEVDVVRSGARALLAYLEAHVERLTEARTEMRGVRYEAESLRIEAGRVPVFAALIEAERTRSAKVRAERNRLAAELAERRRPWLARVLWMFFDRQSPRYRPF